MPPGRRVDVHEGDRALVLARRSGRAAPPRGSGRTGSRRWRMTWAGSLPGGDTLTAMATETSRAAHDVSDETLRRPRRGRRRVPRVLRPALGLRRRAPRRRVDRGAAARGGLRGGRRGGARPRDLLVAARADDPAGGLAGPAAAAGALRALAGAAMAAGVADDISGGRMWFRRAVLPHRPTWNVVAEAGDRDADRTVVLVAHHDAAHWSLLFAPHVAALLRRALPRADRALALDAAGDVPGLRRPAAGRARRRSPGRGGCAAPARWSRSARRRRSPRSARAPPSRAPTTT